MGFGRMFSIQDFGKVNCLKSDFSILLGLLPIFNIFIILQLHVFCNYSTIKFGEYSHQRNYNMSFTSQYYTMIIERFHEMENFKIMNLIMLYYPVQDSVNLAERIMMILERPQHSPFPVPLLKNSSSVDRRGRGLSMGMQYL